MCSLIVNEKNILKCFTCGIELKPNEIKQGWESAYNTTSEGVFCKVHYKEARFREFDRYPKVRAYC